MSDFDKVKLKDPTGELTFHEYINDLSNFSGDPQSIDQATRLRRGLLQNGTDNAMRGTIMIAFRGSVTTDDFNTDRVFAFRNLPAIEQLGVSKDLRSSARYTRNRAFIIEQMETWFNGVPTNGANSYYDFYVTGHSLGGALSETLSVDKLVHGGYSFSAPVDTPVHNLSYTDPGTNQRTRRSLNAPTYRSINRYDKVIGGVTDATTGGDAIYDRAIEGKILTDAKMLGHELDWFKGQQLRTPFQIPPFSPAPLHRLITGPVESLRRATVAVKESKPITWLRSGFNRLTGKGRPKRYNRMKRGRGPPPSYALQLSLASQAYNTSFAEPQRIDVGVQQAILCPAPISNQEVKFYVVRWPLFNSPEERDRVIGPLVKKLTSAPIVDIPAFDKGDRADRPVYSDQLEDETYDNPLIGQGKS